MGKRSTVRAASSAAGLPAAVGKKLSTSGLTLAGAESCTGGLVSQLLTSMPGSSAYFLGSVVAYSNPAKTRLLGVSLSTLKNHGAVSARCAGELALGAARVFRSDLAFSVTGIAGPGGSSAGKPAGLVYFAFARGGKTAGLRRVFPGGRAAVRRAAAELVLRELLKIIE